MSTPRTVIVPLDGSACAEAALPDAIGLCVRLSARLLLVRAIAFRALPTEDLERIRYEAVTKAREELLETAARIRRQEPDLIVGVSLPFGPPAEMILDEVALERPELVVMATRGGRDVTLTHLGKVAKVVSERADVPVLLVHPHAPPAPWLGQRLRLLVPLDGTAAAEAALPFVAELGTHLAVTATVLHVLPDPTVGTPAPNGPTAYEPAAEATAAHALNWASAAGYCHRAAEWMHAHGVAAAVQLRAGRPAEQIASVAHDADVIVLARSRYFGALDHADYVSQPHTASAFRAGPPHWQVPASFADLVRLARVPILVVPSRHGAARSSPVPAPAVVAA